MKDDYEGHMLRLAEIEAEARTLSERSQRALAIWRPLIGIVIVALVAWWGLGLLSVVMKAPERERRIQECAQAMDSELLGHANDSCAGLSKGEQREAAYRWARETGRL